MERRTPWTPCGGERDGDDVTAVTRICRRLDGLPLAIELAASRIRSLSPRQIDDKLGDRFELLSSGSATVLLRQRTLKATLDWSFDLFEADERVVFARTGVFAGGFALGACQAVCGHGGLPPTVVVRLLGNLVDKCLVVAHHGEQTVRYELLERQYARWRLADSEDEEQVRAWHAAYFLELAEEALEDERGSNDPVWAARLRAEHDNLRAALGWAIAAGRQELALRLATATFVLWGSQGGAVEGTGWLRPALAGAPDAPLGLRARALCAAAWLQAHQGDYEAGARLARDALGAARHGREWFAEAWALMTLGCMIASPEMLDQRRALFRELGHSYYLAKATFLRGHCAMVCGRFREAEHDLRVGLDMHEARGDDWDGAFVRLNLSYVAVEQADLESAAALVDEALATFRRLGDTRGVSAAVDRRAVIHRLAATLLAAGDALRDSFQLMPLDRRGFEEDLECLREQLPVEDLDRIWEEGRRLSPNDAAAVALAAAEDVPTLEGQRRPP